MHRLSNTLFFGCFLLLLALAFGATSSHAAFALDSKADCATATSGSSGSDCTPASGGTSATLAWSHTIGTGTGVILVVGVSLRVDNSSPSGSTFVSGIKLGTTNLTCLAAIEDNNAGSCGTGSTGTVFLRSEVWYLSGPATGTATITVTANNATTIVGSSVSYFGVLSIASGGTSASNNGVTGGTNASKSVTSPAGHLVFGNVALAKSSAGNPITVTSGNTDLTDTSDNATSGSHVHGNASDSTAVNPPMSWTFSATSPWAVVTAVLTPSNSRRAHVTVGSLLYERLWPKDGPLASVVEARKYPATE